MSKYEQLAQQPENAMNHELKWFAHQMANGDTRNRLHVRKDKREGWQETPYFVDAASHKSHYTYGHKYGLHGAGMGALVEQADKPYRVAACFGGFDKIKDAKSRAEEKYLTGANHHGLEWNETQNIMAEIAR